MGTGIQVEPGRVPIELVEGRPRFAGGLELLHKRVLSNPKSTNLEFVRITLSELMYSEPKVTATKNKKPTNPFTHLRKEKDKEEDQRPQDVIVQFAMADRMVIADRAEKPGAEIWYFRAHGVHAVSILVPEEEPLTFVTTVSEKIAQILDKRNVDEEQSREMFNASLAGVMNDKGLVEIAT